MTDGDNVVDLDGQRRRFLVAHMNLPPPAPLPDGPFVVTVSNASGKIYEVILPDYRGDARVDDPILATAGCGELLVNLLTGALRAVRGAR